MAGTVPYTEIKNFLATQFSGVYAVVDFDDIETAKVQAEDAFLAVEEILGVEDPISFGDPANICIQEIGGLMIHCFSPAPEASNATRAIADAVRDALRFQILNDVRITDPGVPDPGAQMNDGLWSAASLAVTYQWDTHKARP